MTLTVMLIPVPDAAREEWCFSTIEVVQAAAISRYVCQRLNPAPATNIHPNRSRSVVLMSIAEAMPVPFIRESGHPRQAQRRLDRRLVLRRRQARWLSITTGAKATPVVAAQQT